MAPITRLFSNGVKVVLRSGERKLPGTHSIMDVFKPNGELLLRRFKTVDRADLEITKDTFDFYPTSQKGVKEYLAGTQRYKAQPEGISVWKEIKNLFSGNTLIREQIEHNRIGTMHYHDIGKNKAGKVLFGGIDGKNSFVTEAVSKRVSIRLGIRKARLA